MSRSGRFVAMRQHDDAPEPVADPVTPPADLSFGLLLGLPFAEPVALPVTLIDALGTAPRRRLSLPGLSDFACVDDALWLMAGGALTRVALADGSALGPPLGLGLGVGFGPGRLLAADQGRAALWLGQESLLIREADNGALDVRDLAADVGASACVGLLGGARLALADGPLLRLYDAGRGEVLRASLPLAAGDPGEVLACHHLFGERALAVLVAATDAACMMVLRPDAAVVHRIDLPPVRAWAVAEGRGRAVLYAAPAPSSVTASEDVLPGRLVSVDLRYGRLLARVEAPLAVAELAVDADARYLALAGQRLAADDDDAGDDDDPGDDAGPGAEIDAGPDAATETAGPARLVILHLAYASLLGGVRGQPERDLTAGTPDAGAATGAGDVADPGHTGDAAGKAPGGASAPHGQDIGLAARPEATRAVPLVDAAAVPSDASAPTAPAEPGQLGVVLGPVHIPTGPLLALGPLRRSLHVDHPPQVRPYASASEYLQAQLDLVAAQATRSIADAWDRGELSASTSGQWPFEHTVAGLLGARPGFASDFLDTITGELNRLAEETSQRLLATAARGGRLPLLELGKELDLSALESQVLLIVAAPALRGEIARLYRILAADPRRLPCDTHLVERLLGGHDWVRRRDIALALAPGGKLVGAGLILRDPGPEQRRTGSARLSVDPAVIARVRGMPIPGFGLREAERPLEGLWIPDAVKRELALALATPPRDGTPVRVILRGRRGSGRRTLAASLAARVGRPIADIDCTYLPRPGWALAEALQTILSRAVIGGAVACVSGLEVLGADDAEGLAHVRATLRAHPAPVIVRASPELSPPMDPGYIEHTLPPLDETMRLAFWGEALERHDLRAGDVAMLAARFRVGPGSIEAAARSVGGQRAGAPADSDTVTPTAGDDTAALDTALRQHIESRMGANATRITRLAEWSQVTLPDDLRESVLELIARVRQRRTVYERWGFDRRMQSSRGLSALFFGPPGVGKTMVAGLIARELGLDLYRVDLAAITSKWIGETEKNLSEVFEAGEDGQVVILFDEADSLFAKRTEVQSSVDRHANQQVNYLLQRLDTFEGVAVLTTNREGAIDKAFKRRMTMRLAFPFPDEDMRERLWAAHIPADIPRSGALDLAALARRYPLSGGYIRNCALRAAFLAAADGLPLAQVHLVRAVELEYHEMGKLAPGGRLE
jgi:ATPase family associated with various cellular activities (AAA)